MLGLAIRRHCAPVLDLEPLAPADAYLARRQELGADEVDRRILAAAGIGTFLVDTGLDGPAASARPAELAARLADGDAYEIVRLERVEELLRRGHRPSTTSAAPSRTGSAPVSAVAAKSIAAYRVGLDLPAERPGDATSSPRSRGADPQRRRPDRQRRARPHRTAVERGSRCSSTSATATPTSTCSAATRCT